MKNSVLFAIAALIAICATSCGEQVKKENLTDNLVMFSTTTPEKTRVCGENMKVVSTRNEIRA